jgi:hypothetical protein
VSGARGRTRRAAERPRRLEYLPLDELAPAARNPKRHHADLGGQVLLESDSGRAVEWQVWWRAAHELDKLRCRSCRGEPRHKTCERIAARARLFRSRAGEAKAQLLLCAELLEKRAQEAGNDAKRIEFELEAENLRALATPEGRWTPRLREALA